MTHRFIRADGDMDSAKDDLFPHSAQSVGVIVDRSGVLSRQGECERVAFEPDVVRLLVYQSRLNILWCDCV